MILAVFYKSANGQIRQVEVSGHAGANEVGKDLVCAAASAIVYTAVGAIEELCTIADFYQIVENTEEESIPFVEIRIPKQFETAEAEQSAQVILKTMRIGYKQLEKSVREDFGSCFIQVKDLQYNLEV